MKFLPILLLLASCATTQLMFEKQTTVEQARNDHDECVLESVNLNSQKIETGFGNSIWTDIDRHHFEECMEARGYVLKVVSIK